MVSASSVTEIVSRRNPKQLCGVFVGFGMHFGTGVRASRVTKADLTLVGVAPAFADAVEAQQDAEDAAYDASRAKRKPA